MKVTRSRAPVRIDFAGAWTDCAPFANPFGGATLNAAINRYVTGELRSGEGVLNGRPRVTVPGQGEAELHAPAGLSVSYQTDIPAGSGLGASATLNVVWLSLAKNEPIRTREDRESIAAAAYDIEKILGIIGGEQDQYASAIGGINVFEFTETEVRTKQVGISDESTRVLRSLLVLCYTGQARLSSNIHRSVWGNFQAGKRETVDALFTLRDSAYEGKEILETGDFDRFGPLLTRQFECMKHLDRSTTNETVESVFSIAAGYIAGGKPCGAGGGGCILLCCQSPAEKPALERALRQGGVAVIDFDFDFEGLVLKIEE